MCRIIVLSLSFYTGKSGAKCTRIDKILKINHKPNVDTRIIQAAKKLFFSLSAVCNLKDMQRLKQKAVSLTSIFLSPGWNLVQRYEVLTTILLASVLPIKTEQSFCEREQPYILE